MRKLYIAAAIAILAEALLIVRTSQQNQMVQSRADGLKEELARTTKIVEARDTESRGFRETIAQLQDDLRQANQTLSLTATNKVEAPLAPGGSTEPEPLGLTTNDVDVAGMFISGGDTAGALFVPIRGKILERLFEIHKRRQPLVFGKLLSNSDGWFALGEWKRRGTNVYGIALNCKRR